MASVEISGGGGRMRPTGKQWYSSRVDALKYVVGRADADSFAVFCWPGASGQA